MPVLQHDFGCRDALIGGGQCLEKGRPDPAGESVVSSQAEPSPCLNFRLEEYAMAKRKMSTFERLESGCLNRKQRRELERRVAAADPGLTIVHAHAGGIDVDPLHFA